MILFIIKFIIGLTLIIKGADWLTDGAATMARRWGVSSLVIGLTIVAFGTSAPELVVSLVSGLEGKNEMAIGNVVGSNIFNILAITGITAFVTPIACSRNNIRYDIPLCIISSVLLWSLTADDGVLTRGDGITMLCFFIIFMAYSLAIPNEGQKHDESQAKQMSLVRAALLFVLGLACLVGGGELFVNGASGIAISMGVSQSIVALTIVAAGTSFPELVTSVVAARKGDTDMAMGNVLGSNIFNLLFVLGCASTLTPLPLGNISQIDLVIVIGSVILMWLFCRFGIKKYRIERMEGAILVLCAIGYYAYKVAMEH